MHKLYLRDNPNFSTRTIYIVLDVKTFETFQVTTLYYTAETNHFLHDWRIKSSVRYYLLNYGAHEMMQKTGA